MEINVNVKETIRNNLNGRYAHYKPMIYDNKLDYRHRCLMLGRCEGLAEALFIVLSCFDITEQILRDLKKESKNVDIESNNLHADSNS